MTFNLEAAERAARTGDKTTVVSFLRNACDEIDRLRKQWDEHIAGHSTIPHGYQMVPANWSDFVASELRGDSTEGQKP